MTSETVQKLFDSQMELLGNHQQLKLAHDTIMSNVESNMKSLHQEKSLIATGNKQLAEMVENIKKKLGIYRARGRNSYIGNVVVQYSN